jgi:hypothetical protein
LSFTIYTMNMEFSSVYLRADENEGEAAATEKTKLEKHWRHECKTARTYLLEATTSHSRANGKGLGGVEHLQVALLRR